MDADEAKTTTNQDCEADLASAIEAFSHITESSRICERPPASVKLVMEAMCLLLGRESSTKIDPHSGLKVDDFWHASRTLLDDRNLLDYLKMYDKDNVPPDVMKVIRDKYIPDPHFDPDHVARISTVCCVLCKWIRALEAYDRATQGRTQGKEDETVASEALGTKTMTNKDYSDALKRAINSLDPKDISLVKSMSAPPAGFKLVMEAVCIILGIKSNRLQDPRSGLMVDDFWGPSRKLLADQRFLEYLKMYDKDNIPSDVIKTIREKYIKDPLFHPAKTSRVATPWEGLRKWILALDAYNQQVTQSDSKDTQD